MNNYVEIRFPSLSKNEALARAIAAAFISSVNPTVEELADVRTAVSEAVTNAIVHGYRASYGEVMLQCTLEDNLFTARITDFGCGIEDVALAMQPFFTTESGEERTGMGFAVMEAFMDSVNVESEIGVGTVVTMKKKISNETDEE